MNINSLSALDTLNVLKPIVSVFLQKLGISKSDLSTAIEEYIELQYNKLRFSKNLLFRNSPVDFYSSYMPLTLLNLSTKELINDPFEGVMEYKNVIILGSAGSGKTTLLRYIVLKSIENNFAIPITVDLRTYRLKAETNFEDFVAGHITKSNFTRGDLLHLWSKGGFLFILDGYDEISYTDDSLLINQIENFSQKFKNNSLIISSRLGTNVENLQGYHVFSIQEINENDINIFINKVVSSKYSKEIFMKTIQNDISLRNSLSTPMLVSLYLLAIENKGIDIHKNSKTVFFRIVLDSLFSQHDAVSKLGYVRNKISGLTKDELENISTYIAYISLVHKSYEYSKDQLNNLLNQAKQYYNINVENEKLLYDLIVTVNVLIEESFYYRFPHVLLMEYLSSLFIARLDPVLKIRFYEKLRDNNSIPISQNFLEFIYELDNKIFMKYYYIHKLNELIHLNDEPIKINEMNYVAIKEFTHSLINKNENSIFFHNQILKGYSKYNALFNILERQLQNSDQNNSIFDF